jgi:hypothetical protein
VIGLVERELEVHRLVVEGDVAMVGAGQVHDRDLAHAEVRPHGVRRQARPRQRRVDLVQERIVE